MVTPNWRECGKKEKLLDPQPSIAKQNPLSSPHLTALEVLQEPFRDICDFDFSE